MSDEQKDGLSQPVDNLPVSKGIALFAGVVAVISMFAGFYGGYIVVLAAIALFITLPATVIALVAWACSSVKGFFQVVKLIGFVVVAVVLISVVVQIHDWVTSVSAENSDSDKVSGYVDTINYNYNRTYGFSLYDLTTERDAPLISGGAHVLDSGGNVNCCIALPKQWRPGLKVRLDWRESDHTWSREGDTFDVHRELIGEHTEEFEIPHYDQPGNLFIVFLPEGKVELVVSQVEPASPDWPGSIKQTPWNYCVEKNGRFPCKLTLPKLSLSFREMTGFCSWIKEENRDMKTCEKAIAACVHDYEDKALCERVLWGKEESK
jgi:hypothetical protein